MWGGIVTAIIAVVSFIILMVLFFTIGHANIPVRRHTTSVFTNSLAQAKIYRCLDLSTVNKRRMKENFLIFNFFFKSVHKDLKHSQLKFNL